MKTSNKISTFSKLAITGIFAATLSACVYVDGNHQESSSHKKEKENRELISELELQMPHGEVASRLGKPYFSEALAKDGDEYRVMYYVTGHHSDHFNKNEKTTPLIFKNGKLIGWGAAMLDVLKK